MCSQLPGDVCSSVSEEDQGTGVQRGGVGTRRMGNAQAPDRNAQLSSAGSMLKHLSASKDRLCCHSLQSFSISPASLCQLRLAWE